MNKSLFKTFSVLTILALMLAALPMQRAVAAAPDLFFSEYIEGSSFNKAVEIYNGTGASVDLSTYSVELYSNGAGSPSATANLSGTLADGDVFVMSHASAAAAILAVADMTSSTVINFNGDDAVVLRKGGAVVDAFGQVGFDPGTQWLGGGENDTLRRADTVCAGDTNAGDAFDASVEWVVFPQDTFSGLGAHTATCGTTTAEPKINEFSASTAGTDVEYVEFIGDPSTDYSAYTLLEIEGDFSLAATGTIDEVVSLGTTDANGFYLASLPANALENGTITLLLVENFTGSLGNDLDTNEDGTLDVMPWDAITDSVAVSDGGATDLTYGAPVLGPNYDGLSAFAPGGASRIPDGFDTEAATDWVRNDFDLLGIPGFTGTPQAGEALNTPGMPNALISVLPDILINEVDSDTPGTDALEFVELYDGGDGNTSLDGLVVVFFNGSNDLSYASFDLDGFSTDANGYFVLGNSGVTPAPGLTFAGNLLQNGADAVALYQGDAADFPANTAITTTDLIDAIAYDTADADDAGLLALLNAGEPQVDEAGGGDSANHSNQRCPNGSGGARNTTTYAQFAPTAGAVNSCETPVVVARIHEVQGSGASVAITGKVQVEAIVVADYQNSDQLSGFFLQEEDVDIDGDANTSEGIFVYCGGCAIDVAVGDQVQATGQAEEFFGMSQIDLTGDGILTVLSSGNPLPTPAAIDLPASGSTRSASTFENIEGMLVTFTDTLYVSEYFELARYGQLVMTADARPSQFTDANEPSIPGYAAFLSDLNSKRIILDDDNNIQNDALGSTPA